MPLSLLSTAGSRLNNAIAALPQFESAKITPSAGGRPARLSAHLTIFSGPWHALGPFSATS